MACIMAPLKSHYPLGDSANQSTILPFPSSPHWVPMMTIFLLMLQALKNGRGGSPGPKLNPKLIRRRGGCYRLNHPLFVTLHQLTIDTELVRTGFLVRKLLYHNLALTAKLFDRRE